MTTLKEAFVKAGTKPEDVEFSVAITKYLNCGGTIQRAHALLDDAAKRLPGDGQSSRAEKAIRDLPKPGNTQASDDGHSVGASHGHTFLAKVARPLPQPSRRNAAVMAAADAPARLAIWDTMTVKGGKAWRFVRYGELKDIAFEGSRDAALARLIKNHAANADAEATVEKIVSISTFQQFVQKSVEVADV